MAELIDNFTFTQSQDLKSELKNPYKWFWHSAGLFTEIWTQLWPTIYEAKIPWFL